MFLVSSVKASLFSMLLIAVFQVTVNAQPQSSLRLVVLDVGEGQSVLLVQDHYAVLVDTGHVGKAQHVLSRMQSYGVKQLDYLLLTHLHADHAGGYFRLREAWPDTPLLDNCHLIDERKHVSEDTVRWIYAGVKEDKHIRCIKAMDRFQWRGHQLEVLWPKQQPPTGNNLNQHSVVLAVHSNTGHTALLMGDANRQVEQTLHQSFKADNKDKQYENIAVYVAGHHGASDTGDADFIAYLKPKYSAVSVNADNLRNYPSADTINVLQQFSQILYRTDEDGELCFQFAEHAAVSVCK